MQQVHPSLSNEELVTWMNTAEELVYMLLNMPGDDPSLKHVMTVLLIQALTKLRLEVGGTDPILH